MQALIGPHVRRNDSASHQLTTAITNAIALAAESGVLMRAAAVFVSSPRGRQIAMQPADCAELKEVITRHRLRVIAHGGYADSVVLTARGRYGLPHLANEMAVCQRAGIEGLVVHLPKAGVAAPQLLACIEVARAAQVRLILETPAIVDSVYATPAQIAALVQLMRFVDPHFKHLGLCVDSAHLWVSGVSWRGYAETREWLAQLERTGLPAAALSFHLNDSERPLGKGPDTHAALGQGHIWSGIAPSDSGVRALLEFAARLQTPILLERNDGAHIAGDYAFLRAASASHVPAPVVTAAAPAIVPVAAPVAAPAAISLPAGVTPISLGALVASIVPVAPAIVPVAAPAAPAAPAVPVAPVAPAATAAPAAPASVLALSNLIAAPRMRTRRLARSKSSAR